MRITFVVHQFPPRYFTGTEQYALAVGCELRRRGHDVDVFTLDPAFGEATGPWRESREIVEGLPVRRINFWMNLGRDWRRMEYRHPLMAEVFGRHLRERGSEVVHCFHLRHVGADLIDRAVEQQRGVVISLMDFWFLCPRVILMRREGAPCDGPPDGGRGCVPCHAPELAAELARSGIAAEIDMLLRAAPVALPPRYELAARTATLLDRPAYLRRRLEMASALVAPTRHLLQTFVANGAPADRLHHMPYGVDTGSLAEDVARLRPGARPLTFGFIGSYAPHKGPHLLIEAIAKVRGDCRVVLRGRRSDFADYSARLDALAAGDGRIAVGEPFARRELPAALAAIDVLVVPSSWHENAPFVVLEARAAGLPVLASRFGGLAEVVDDGVDGELFTSGDANDLAWRLQRLVDEPERVERYRRAVRPPQSLAAAVDGFERLYADALGPRGVMLPQ